jgi:anti-anti-sigma factor
MTARASSCGGSAEVRGRILVGELDGVHVLLFKGDVRLTLCKAMDDYLAGMLEDPCIRSIVVDLSETENIDSTSLGLLAKLSIESVRRFGYRPTLVSTQPDITRILETMGLDEVFNLVQQALEREEQLGELPPCAATEAQVRARVLESHRILMDLNEHNRAVFQDLVTALEGECGEGAVSRSASL